jgi:hypothetical protein
MAHCPDTDRLRQLLADELDVDAQRLLQAHLESCPECPQILERLAARGPSWDRAALHLGGPQEATDPALAQAVEELEATELNLGTPPDEETQGERRPTPGDELPFLDPPAEPGHLGRMGYYEVYSIVGRGGMGVVLKAFDERLHRIVAVKVLGPQYATSGSARARFAREAKAAAAVSHDHVVPIYDVGEHRGIPFLVMPLIAGKSLQDRIEQDGPLELKEILRIGLQIACGLAAAHKQGLVHRDIKPANILLENGIERVKITDFGLARAVDDASVTQSGVITGTPMFMSPEQARGEFTFDARSDLFSLGSVLYMMATGRPPFRAAGTHAVLRRVIEETPRPLRDVNADIPDWLEAIVAKLHAKRPDDRFQTAQELADLLGQHLAHMQEPRRVEMPAPVTAPTPARLEKLLDATDTRLRLIQHGGMLGSLVLLALGLLLIVMGGRMAMEKMTVGVWMMFVGGVGLIAVSRVKQRWEVHYRGHIIRLVNSAFRGEGLFIDDVLVARGGLGARSELRGLIRHGDAAGDEIMVRCEPALLSFRCRIFVEQQAVRVAPSFARQAARTAGSAWVKPALIVGGVFLAAGCGLVAVLFGGAVIAGLGAFFLLQAGPAPMPPAHRIDAPDARAVPPPNVLPGEMDGKGIQVPMPPIPAPVPGGLGVPLPNLKPGEMDEPWMQLLNGKDLTGWMPTGPGKNAWRVDETGNLVVERPEAPSYLFAAGGAFVDFHLRTEVNVAAGSNAGICFRCGLPPLPGKLPSGYEVKLGAGEFKKQRYGTGTLFQIPRGFDVPMLAKAAHGAAPVPDGIWFKMEVIARGKHIVVKVADKTVIDDLVLMPNLATGGIALHAGSPQSVVHVRTIEVKALPTKGPLKDGPP